MIRSTGVFLQTTDLLATFHLRHRKLLDNGILALRTEDEDLPILADWPSAKAFLSRFKAETAKALSLEKPTLGRVWIEQLPGMSATPWTIEEDDYAQAHIRTRTPLVQVPNGITLSGTDALVCAVGVVSVVEHRTLHSELNLSDFPRVTLVVDVRRPDGD